MKAQSKGGQPELLSTHPSEERRIANLKEWIPHAKALAWSNVGIGLVLRQYLERNKPSLDFILKILHAYPSVKKHGGIARFLFQHLRVVLDLERY